MYIFCLLFIELNSLLVIVNLTIIFDIPIKIKILIKEKPFQ